jgi:hypothetical protein
MPTASTAASEFILIPSETYKQLQRQPPDEPATTIERQADLASKTIPENVKPKIIAAIDRNPISDAEGDEEGHPVATAAVAAAADDSSTTNQSADASVSMDTSELAEADVVNLTTRQRIFKRLDVLLKAPIKRLRARQIFDKIVAHSRITLEPHTQSFVVDKSTFNMVDAVTFLSDTQNYSKKNTRGL